jgi:4'-phosphopantetheinyl transferase
MRIEAPATRPDFSRNVHCVLGLPIDAVDLAAVERRIRAAAASRSPCFLSTPNVNFLIACRSDDALRDSAINSDLSVADLSKAAGQTAADSLPSKNGSAGHRILLRRVPVSETAIDKVEIAVAGLQVEPEFVRASAALLSDAERRRASRFAFDRERRRFTVARARLRQLLAERLGVRPEAIELTQGVHGKPALARRCGYPDLRFNVSHCEDVAVYAFASGREVGIDVEAVRALCDADEIAARFFSRRENEAYLGLDPSDRPLGFFNCWTRKEAFIKALGEGLSHPLDRFDVSLAPSEEAEILRVDDRPGDECGWCLQSFFPAPGFVASVVVERAASRRSVSLGHDGGRWLTARGFAIRRPRCISPPPTRRSPPG